jgi:hypothetical protein
VDVLSQVADDDLCGGGDVHRDLRKLMIVLRAMSWDQGVLSLEFYKAKSSELFFCV